MEYPKINSIYKRETLPGGTVGRLIPGQYACPEFASFSQWRVEEKIDGMNIRVFVDGDRIEIKGRTEHALLPPKLLQYFEGLKPFLLNNPIYPHPYILFGEGFGAGIQKGGIYRKDVAFCLFDVYTNRWSTREEVYAIAERFGLDRPHDFGLMTELEILNFVESQPSGKYNDKGYPMEGVMCRSEPLMRCNTYSAHPIQWKLKAKDFQ